MKVFVGIDVGGTCTDYAALKNGTLLMGGKIENKLSYIDSITYCLQKILHNIPSSDIGRITISTTAITNFIISKKYNFPKYVVLPGPGVDPGNLSIPSNYLQLDGAIDFRGREIKPLTNEDLQNLKNIHSDHCAVIGKFSGRNPEHELTIEHHLKKNGIKDIFLGHKISSELNFPRRINTTLFYAVTKKIFQNFRHEISEALSNSELASKVFFLTSDGGLVHFEEDEANQLTTVMSGPVASVMGALALSPQKSLITMDVGGTTTDFGLILNEKPLFAEKGITLNNLPTAISAFAVYSVPLGGDTPVDVTTGELGQVRQGPAMAFGGTSPTLTDALNAIGITKAGDYTISQKNLNAKTAKLAVNKALELLKTAVENIFTSWQNEPAYHLWEMKQPIKKLPAFLLGLGGGALGLTQGLAKMLNLEALDVKYFDIANAIGTALVKPSVTVTLHADTAQNIYQHLETSEQLNLSINNIDELLLTAEELARNKYHAIYSDSDNPTINIVKKDQFNIIRGYSTIGKIMHAKVVIPSAVIYKVVK